MLITQHRISSFYIDDTIYSIYHSNIILFGIQELSYFIFPGLFNELKIRSKNPDLFNNIISTPSHYKLPSYIKADKLSKKLCKNLSNSLLFIHTWAQENKYKFPNVQNIIEQPYATYKYFFKTMFSFIIDKELDSSISNLASCLRKKLKTLYPYLGNFYGKFEYMILNTKDVIIFLIFLSYTTYLYNRIITLDLD